MKPEVLRLLLSRGSSRSLLIIAIAGAVLGSLLVLFNGFLLAKIITGIINHESHVGKLIVGLGIYWLVRAIYYSQLEYWCSAQASKIKNELRKLVTSKSSGIKSIPNPELSAVLIKGINSLDVYLGRFLPQLFSATLIPLTVISVLFILDPLSALIALLTLPLIPIFGAMIGKYTSDSVSKKWRTLGTLSRYFEDSLQGFVTLRIFGRSKTQSVRIKEMGDKYTAETIAVLKISFLSALVLELVATISVALIAVSIGLRLLDGKVSFTHSLIVLVLAPEIYFPLRNAASLFHASADGVEILEKVSPYLIEELESIEQRPKDFSEAQSLSWSEWTLAIPGIPESTLPPASLARGETLYLIGDSGIGKSTFVESLLGFRLDCSLAVNNRELVAENVQAWRERCGWIPQSPRLLSGTIRDQFHLYDESLSDDAITDALQKVSISLSDLPHGLDSRIGGADEKSAEISGGQLRKIAIARALIRTPFLIIADEPTADLDHESSEEIMATLRNATKGGAILICITHDVNVIQPGARVLELKRVADA